MDEVKGMNYLTDLYHFYVCHPKMVTKTKYYWPDYRYLYLTTHVVTNNASVRKVQLGVRRIIVNWSKNQRN